MRKISSRSSSTGCLADESFVMGSFLVLLAFFVAPPAAGLVRDGDDSMSKDPKVFEKVLVLQCFPPAKRVLYCFSGVPYSVEVDLQTGISSLTFDCKTFFSGQLKCRIPL